MRVPRDQRIVPVIIGGDVGAYSLARAFHERDGSVSVIVSKVLNGIIADSAIVENSLCPDTEIPDALFEHVLDVGRRLMAEADGVERVPMLFGAADGPVMEMAARRKTLEEFFVVPYPELELMERVTRKDSFSGLCAELEIDHPRTAIADLALLASIEADRSGPTAAVDLDAIPGLDELRYPLVAKPVDTVEYAQISYGGKAKVHFVDDSDEARGMLSRLLSAGYRGRFVLQERIPGDDSEAAIITCFRDSAGEVTLAAYGQVLIEEHTPGAIGNMAALLTSHDRVVAEQAKSLLDHVGWTGFCCFDLKRDPRDGRVMFFELNQRLGRGNYYVTASGNNVADYYVAEYCDPDHRPDPGKRVDASGAGKAAEAEPGILYSVLPARLVARYVVSSGLRAEVRRAIRRRRVISPLRYPADRSLARARYLLIRSVNQSLKFVRSVGPPRRLREQSE